MLTLVRFIGSQRVFSATSQSAPLLPGLRESATSTQFKQVRRDTGGSIPEGGGRTGESPFFVISCTASLTIIIL